MSNPNIQDMSIEDLILEDHSLSSKYTTQQILDEARRRDRLTGTKSPAFKAGQVVKGRSPYTSENEYVILAYDNALDCFVIASIGTVDPIITRYDRKQMGIWFTVKEETSHAP